MKPYNILITGGSGRLCGEILKANQQYHNIIAPPKMEMDITNYDCISEVVKTTKPDIIIHAAALTNPLSIHEENPTKSININIVGTCNIVKICIENDIKLIYISTDYVYPKNKINLKETDALLPFNNYGWSKLGGECAVKMHKKHLIIRGSLYPTPFPHEKAFSNILRNNIYQDEAARIILLLLEKEGTINIGSNETKSYFELAKQTNKNVIASICTQEDMASIMILNLDKLNNYL